MGVCLPPFFAVGRADRQHELRGPLVRQAQHKLSDVPGYADKLEGEDRDVLTYDQKIRKIGKLLTSLRERNRIEIGEKRAWVLKK